jgi:hypothetical protein
MPTLAIPTVELVSTLRTAPLNGSPSSQDYNDSAREVLSDLAAITSLLNDTICQLLDALPTTSLSTYPPIGIEGRTIYADTSDKTALFFNSKTVPGTPLVIADSLRYLQSIVLTIQMTLNNQQIQISALQSRLATTNQNDVAAALQNFAGSLTALTAAISNLQARVTALEA